MNMSDIQAIMAEVFELEIFDVTIEDNGTSQVLPFPSFPLKVQTVGGELRGIGFGPPVVIRTEGDLVGWLSGAYQIWNCHRRPKTWQWDPDNSHRKWASHFTSQPLGIVVCNTSQVRNEVHWRWGYGCRHHKPESWPSVFQADTSFGTPHEAMLAAENAHGGLVWGWDRRNNWTYQWGDQVTSDVTFQARAQDDTEVIVWTLPDLNRWNWTIVRTQLHQPVEFSERSWPLPLQAIHAAEGAWKLPQAKLYWVRISNTVTTERAVTRNGIVLTVSQVTDSQFRWDIQDSGPEPVRNSSLPTVCPSIEEAKQCAEACWRQHVGLPVVGRATNRQPTWLK